MNRPAALDRSWLRAATLTLSATAVALSLGVAAPASANTAREVLALSPDGVHFDTASVPAPFAASGLMVPGQSLDGQLWVRNTSDVSAQLSVAVATLADTSNGLLAQQLHLDLQAAGQAARLEGLAGSGDHTCRVVPEVWTIPAGATLRLDLGLGLSLAASNATRNQSLSLELRLALQETPVNGLLSPCGLTTAPDEGGASAGAIIGTPLWGTPMADPRMGSPISVQGEPGGAIALDGGAAVVPGPTGTPLPSGLEAGALASTVEATTRSPWPWLTGLSAAVYLLIARKTRRRTA